MEKGMPAWRVWLARVSVIVGLIFCLLALLIRVGLLGGVSQTQLLAGIAAFTFAIFVLLDGRWSE